MFSGRMSRGAYARAVAIRIGLFVVGNVTVFLALWWMDKFNACRSEGCFAATGALTVFVVWPALYLLLVLSSIGITVRRMRDIGLPIWLAAAVPVLMLGDIINGMMLGVNISSAFTHLNLMSYSSVPRFLIVAGICVLFLCVARSKDETERAQHCGVAGALALGIVMLTSIGALLSFGDYLTSVLGGLDAMQTFGKLKLYYGLFGSPNLLLVMFVLFVRQQRRLSTA